MQVVSFLWPDGGMQRVGALALSPFVGSFLGVVILRLPDRRPIAIARSRCDHCGAALGPGDLIPLLSYVALRGRCRHCAAAIGAFYPAVELAALSVAASAAWLAPPDALWVDCVLGWLLLALAWIDLRTRLLPDRLTLPLIAGGLAQAWLFKTDVLASAIGAAVGYGVIWSLFTVYRRLRGREGIGLGDAKLLSAGGAWLGWENLPLILLAASLSALATVGVAHLFGRRVRGDTQIPFGPFLAFAIWAVRLISGVTTNNLFLVFGNMPSL